MSTIYSRSQLDQLMRQALSGDDAGSLLRVAVKACRSSGAPAGEVVLSIRPSLERAARPALRRFFRTLGRLGQLEELVPLVGDRSREIRLALIHAFFNFGRSSDAETLERLLADEDAEVVKRAREAIGQLRDPSYVPAAVDDVDGGLTETERLIARLMLGEDLMGEASQVAGLLFNESGAVRGLARAALPPRDVRVHDALLDSLETALESGAPLTPEAADALKEAGDTRAAQVLMRGLAGDRVSQRHATDALLALGSTAGAVLLDVFRTDPIRMSNGVLVARTAGLGALDAFLSALTSPLRAVRETAVAGLVELGAPSELPLVDVLRRVPRAFVVDGLMTLERIATAASFDLIRECERSPEPEIRAAAIRALARFQERDEAHLAVGQAFESPDWRIRLAAADTIGQWHWRHREAIGWLSDAAVADPHRRVREAAAASLSRLADDQGLDARVQQLVDAVEQDGAAHAEAELEIERLRGVLAAYFDRPRISSPEGSRRRAQLRQRLQRVTDLEPYAGLRRHLPAVQPQHATLSPEEFSTTEVAAPVTDDVRFTVTSPVTVVPGRPCVLDVWVHGVDAYDTLLDYVRRDPRTAGGSLRSKGPVSVRRGTMLVVRISVPGLAWHDEDRVYWAATIGNATFSFTVPGQAAGGEHAGLVQVFAAGVQIARVTFLITVAAARGAVQDVTSLQQRVSTAFASYASEDRDEVLARIQGMLSVAPDLDIFVDVVSLRSGERWEARLEEEIVRRDVLYLFWSTAASQSAVVDREWRIALRSKGLQGINPVPLETPEKAPPPPELASLHFNQWTLQVMQ